MQIYISDYLANFTAMLVATEEKMDVTTLTHGDDIAGVVGDVDDGVVGAVDDGVTRHGPDLMLAMGIRFWDTIVKNKQITDIQQSKDVLSSFTRSLSESIKIENFEWPWPWSWSWP